MTPEQAAQRIAVALNGGEFRNGQWCSEGQRQAWIKAVEPVMADAVAHGTAVYIRHEDGRIEHVDLEDYLEPRLGEQGA